MCGSFSEKSVWSICVATMVATLAALSVGSPAWAEAVIDVADLEVANTGDSITSPVMVNSVTNLGSGTIYVDFDSSVVDVTGVAAGQLPDMFSWNEVDQGGGITRLIVMGMNFSSGQSGNITFADVTYQAVGSPGSSSALDLVYNGDLLEYDYTPILHTLNDGSFAVVPEPASVVLLAGLAVAGVMVLRRRRRA